MGIIDAFTALDAAKKQLAQTLDATFPPGTPVVIPQGPGTVDDQRPPGFPEFIYVRSAERRAFFVAHVTTIRSA